MFYIPIFHVYTPSLILKSFSGPASAEIPVAGTVRTRSLFGRGNQTKRSKAKESKTKQSKQRKQT